MRRILLPLLLTAQPALALEELTGFDNRGHLKGYLHAPAEAPDLPLVVALHGCTQDASHFDDETGLTALADATPFLLLLPEQQPTNMFRNCFRFFDTADNRPGKGESASIMAMIDTVIASHHADPNRVYILGLSAGGAMTAVMLANHPDRFAGGAILAGLPFDCNRPAGFWDWGWYSRLWFSGWAEENIASYTCGLFGTPATDRAPDTWAGYIRTVSDPPETWPKLSLWQGRADETVDPANLRELTEQWATVMDLPLTPTATEPVGTATHATWGAALETWDLPTFGHAVPIDPDTGCGAIAPHIEDADLCAVSRITSFWGLTP